MRRTCCATWTCLLVATACHTQSEPPHGTSSPPTQPGSHPVTTATSAPFDVGAIVRQVHFAYRKEGEDLVGGHATYATRVRGSRLTFTPFHHPQGRKEPLVGAPLQLETLVVSRGVPQQARAVPSVAKDGSLELRRAGVVETLRNGDGGVEQSWTFEKQPTGTGDLVVRLHVSGLGYRGETAQGLHFADDGAQIGVRYGLATWIDARGFETEIRPHYEHGEIRLEVPADLLARSAYPAILDPLIGGESGADTPVVGPADMDQFAPPAIASDGRDFLVVWGDYRASFAADIVGARVLGSGTLVDETGFLISYAPGTQVNPAIAYGGGQFFVTWTDYRSGVSSDIYGARVDPQGGVLDKTGIALSTTSFTEDAPDVASDGSSFLVVWADSRNGTRDIFGRRVNATGTPDSTETPLVKLAADQEVPTVAYGAQAGVGKYLVAYQDNRDAVFGQNVYAMAFLSTTLAPGSEIPISTLAGAQYSPAVASDGTNFLVTFSDDRGTGDVYGQLVTYAGKPSGSEIALATGATARESKQAVTYGFGMYFVSWADESSSITNTDVYGRAVTPGGVPMSVVAIATFTDSQDYPAVAPGVDATSATPLFFTVYEERPLSLSTDIMGARVKVDATLSVLDKTPLLVSKSANGQRGPSVAFDGTNYLVVFSDTRNGKSDIFGTRVSPTTGPLDASGIAISTAPDRQFSPDVAYNPTGGFYLVVWSDFRNGLDDDLYAARVNPNGTVNPADVPQGIKIDTTPSDSAEQPATSCTQSGRCLVVWREPRTKSDIYGRIMQSTGSVGPEIIISAAAGVQKEPDVAGVGDLFVVVWADQRAGSFRDIYGAVIDAVTEKVVKPDIAVSTEASAHQDVPAVACDGNDTCLVVWDDFRNSNNDIYGARLVLSTGSLLDSAQTGFPVGVFAGTQTRPAVAWDGFNFAVAWADQQLSFPLMDILGTWITVGGKVLYPAGVTLSAEATEEEEPALAAAASGQLALVYHRLDMSAGQGSQRAKGRFVSNGSLVGQSCTEGATCVSGSCADGVCCTTACGLSVDSDCQACATAKGALAQGICTVLAAKTSCRPTTTDCDVAEVCDGSSAACPPDTFVPALDNKVCLSATTTCEKDATCSGTSSSCPANPIKPKNTVCKAATGDCDLDAACDGATNVCPPNPFQAGTVQCRAQGTGGCDVAEFCTGSTATCPSDGFASASLVCRDLQGDCDLAETCTGASSACPEDQWKTAGTLCRTLGGDCDVVERCSGTSPACPDDTFLGSTTVCRKAAAGGCDVAETCTGMSVTCPEDKLASALTVCRPLAEGGCDVEEICSGDAADCPVDQFAPFTKECRASTDACDPGESCSGTGSSCPSDVDHDLDDDQICVPVDNCPDVKNFTQADFDKDLVGDDCDADDDNDGVSDAIELDYGLKPKNKDTDGDRISDGDEFGSSVTAADSDGDDVIDALDDDSDNDGITDRLEAGDDLIGTPPIHSDADAVADFRDDDSDDDTIKDGLDNCRLVPNETQVDTDGDKIGDACEGDTDGDGINDTDDNCPSVKNADQKDNEKDGLGDTCDDDDDNDSVGDEIDNCPLVANANQIDVDKDQIGDACDPSIAIDAGTLDGGNADGGMQGDAGSDAAAPDSEVGDAGRDAASLADGGGEDASTALDAKAGDGALGPDAHKEGSNEDVATESFYSWGCRVSGQRSPGSAAPLLFSALLLGILSRGWRRRT